MPEVQVVVAHRARATLRVGDVFLKVDLGRAGIDAEVAAIGDLQPDHVFVSEDQVTGIIDWSSAGAGDPPHDLAVLTLGHPEHLDDVLAGYGDDHRITFVHPRIVELISNEARPQHTE